MRVYEINFSCHTSIYQLSSVLPLFSFSLAESRLILLLFTSKTIEIQMSYRSASI